MWPSTCFVDTRDTVCFLAQMEQGSGGRAYDAVAPFGLRLGLDSVVDVFRSWNWRGWPTGPVVVGISGFFYKCFFWAKAKAAKVII